MSQSFDSPDAVTCAIVGLFRRMAPHSSPDPHLSTSDASAKMPAGRPFPIKALILFLIGAQPFFVAIALYYKLVVKKEETQLCDPALRAALVAPAVVPAASLSYYQADPSAQKGYEEGWSKGYKEMIQLILDGGCNGAPPKSFAATETPQGAAEEARANGVNDGALAAQALPRECLNQCWRLVIRRPANAHLIKQPAEQTP